MNCETCNDSKFEDRAFLSEESRSVLARSTRRNGEWWEARGVICSLRSKIHQSPPIQVIYFDIATTNVPYIRKQDEVQMWVSEVHVAFRLRKLQYIRQILIYIQVPYEWSKKQSTMLNKSLSS